MTGESKQDIEHMTDVNSLDEANRAVDAGMALRVQPPNVGGRTLLFDVVALFVINYPIHVAAMVAFGGFSIWKSLILAVPTTAVAAIFVAPAFVIAMAGYTVSVVLGAYYLSTWFVDVVTAVIP